MDSGDDNALFIVDSILKFRWIVTISYRLNLSLLVVETQNGVLQLIVQYTTVCHHKYRLEHLLILIIMQRRQTIG